MSNQENDKEKEIVYVKARTGDWMGRSLFLTKFKTYFYKDLMEFLLHGKPTKILWVSGAAVLIFAGVMVAGLAGQMTSTLSIGYGLISGLLVFGTFFYMAYLVFMPSDDTNLFTDSMTSFIYSVKRKPSFRGLKMGYELSEDESCLVSKNGKDVIQFWLVNGNISQSTLAEDINHLYDQQLMNRLLLAKATVFTTTEMERTTFEENKAHLNDLIDSDLPDFSKMLARYEKKHIHSNLEGELSRRTVLGILTTIEDAEKAQDYISGLWSDSVISSFEPVEGDRLRRYLDSL